VTKLLQTFVDGLAVGSLYALIALGYTMVYGILQFINFAHSDIFMLGAWVSFLLARAMGWTSPDADIPLWAGPVVLLGAMTVCGTLGFTIERLAYRPLRSAPRLNVLITAIGISLLLENVGQLPFVFGTQPERMPTLLPTDTLFTVAGVNIELVDVLVVGNAIVLMAALDWLVFRTKMGRAMRAVSFSPKVAALMGIPVDRVISFTFVVGSSLAAAAGLLYATKYPGINQPAHATWILLGLKAFVAAVIGGIGHVPGAVVGALALGLCEEFVAGYTSSSWRDAVAFGFLILVLLFRPEGLFGRVQAEKV